jgi:hypothetical protein
MCRSIARTTANWSHPVCTTWHSPKNALAVSNAFSRFVFTANLHSYSHATCQPFAGQQGKKDSRAKYREVLGSTRTVATLSKCKIHQKRAGKSLYTLAYTFDPTGSRGLDGSGKVSDMPEDNVTPEAPAIAPEPPRASPVNWEAVRVLAVAVGVREAARRMEVSEEATMKRSQREGWLASPEAREANRQLMTARIAQSRTLSAVCPQGGAANLLAQEITDLGRRGRLGHARSQAAIAERIAERDPDENLADMQNVKAAVQSASLVFGWDKNNSGAGKIRLEVIASPGHTPTYDVESEVVPNQDWEES